MTKKVTIPRDARTTPKGSRGGSAGKTCKSAAGSILSRGEAKIKRYVCPNCDSDKDSPRGRCPICGYGG